MKNKNLITILVVAVIVGAASFYGGMQYQQSKAQSGRGNFAGFRGQGGAIGQRGGGRGFGGATVGQVVGFDSKMITLKLADGSSKIVDISGSTTYSATSTASASNIKNGTTIAAIGIANSDGSITAQNIQINPAFRMRQNNSGQ